MRNSTAHSLVLLALVLALSAAPSLLVNAQLLDTFVMSVSPSTLTVMQGDSGTAFISVTSINNFSAPVSLTFSGAPSGVSVTFDNNPVTPPPGGSDSSTAYFSVDPSVPASTYPMTLVGTSGSDTKNYDFTLQVTPQPQPGDFGISVNPSSVTAAAGGSTSATVAITSIDGWNSPVTLTADGQPPDVSVNFSPSTVTPPAGGSANSAVSISVSSTVQAGLYPITITGSGTGGTAAVITEHSTQLDLQVTSQADFTITVNPSSINIQQGQSTTATVTISPIGGFSSPVGLSTSNGVPSGVQVGFSPNPLTPGSSTMSINVASSASTGKFSFQILGTSGSISHTTTFTITISAAAQPSFSLSSSARSVSLAQAGSNSVKILVTSINGFSSPVSTYTSWVGTPPTGITISGPGTLTPPAGGTTSGTLTLTASSAASVGSYLLTVVGTSGSLTATTNIGIQIMTGAGDYSISLSPSSVTIVQGSSTISTLTIRSTGSFSSPVSLSASPASGLSVTFATNPLTPSAGGAASTQLTIAAMGSTGTGTYTIPIIGTGGSLSHSTSITVTVNEAETPDFSVAAGPNALTITQGGSGNSVIAVLSQVGFNQPVTLSTSWQGSAPGGVTVNLPGPVTPQPNSIATSTLMVSALAGSSTGTFTLMVTGSSGGLVRSTPVTVQISGSSVTTTSSTATSSATTSTSTPTPHCFIATATYGSDMAPQVQFLRELRDKQIMTTYVGWNFMIAFNAWYYSFSPSVAQSITHNPTLQYSARIGLYPLMAILDAGSTPFRLLSSHPEVAAVLSGLLMTSMIGIVYLSLPFLIIRRYTWKRGRLAKRTERALVTILVASLAEIALGEIILSGQLTMFASVSTALSTLILAPLVTSRKLLQLAQREGN